MLKCLNAHPLKNILKYNILNKQAKIAQLAEQRTRNAQAVGSNPALGSSHFNI